MYNFIGLVSFHFFNCSGIYEHTVVMFININLSPKVVWLLIIFPILKIRKFNFILYFNKIYTRNIYLIHIYVYLINKIYLSLYSQLENIFHQINMFTITFLPRRYFIIKCISIETLIKITLFGFLVYSVWRYFIFPQPKRPDGTSHLFGIKKGSDSWKKEMNKSR